MAKLHDAPPARAFRVGQGPPNGAQKAKSLPAQPAQSAVKHDLPPFAKGIGMDTSALAMLRREMRPISVDSLIEGKGGVGGIGGDEAGDSVVAQFPGCAVPLSAAAYSCSEAVFSFLAENVLRNVDIIPITRSGWVTFDNALGVHSIPLDLEDSTAINADKLPGDIRVPNTQALIVTAFQPFAALNMPGLPGAFISIDPQSLIGQVAFFLRADNGTHPLGEQTITQGFTGSGTEIVNDPTAGSITPPFTDVAKQGVGAAYKVLFSPTPGFPSIVGVRLRGYMINQQLLAEALDNKSYRAGG